MSRQEEVHKAILETELTTEEEIEALWEKKKAKYMTQGNRLNDPDKEVFPSLFGRVLTNYYVLCTGDNNTGYEFTAKATPDVLKTVEMIKLALK